MAAHVRIPSMGQIDLYEIMSKIILNFIDKLSLETLMPQLNIKCLTIENDCEGQKCEGRNEKCGN